jgi:hypothetical protein
MNDFFKKIKDVLSGNTLEEKDSEESTGNPKPLTNQKIIDKIIEVYKQRFKEETTRQTMLFPTCFRIYLHPSDFEKRQDAFNVLSRDLANEFNAFNRAEMNKYKHNIPHAEYWLFQFVELKKGEIVDDIDTVEMGDLYTISTLYSKDFSKNKDNISNEGNVVMTKQPKNSTNPQELNNTNINAFLGMEMLDGNRYKVDIKENYEEVKVIPKSEDKTQILESDTFAYLICDKNFISDTQRGNKYNITTNYVFISGKNDTRSGVQYVNVDYPLPIDIVQIKHENGKFLLAAFGKVRLNQILVPESKGAPDWMELSDNSRILINDEVSIEFKRIK